MDNLPEKNEERWGGLELRTLMLFSLFLQSFLIIFGNRRQHMAGRWWPGKFVWLAYLLADYVAIYLLGLMSCIASRGLADSEKNDSTEPKYILAIWAPILLVHLGGPDTITAYSMEDNELWSRHVLTLLTQVGGAFYVSLKLWNYRHSQLPLAAIPIFVVGLYKYGEKVWLLWSASSKKIRDSIIKQTDAMDHLLYLKIYDQSALAEHLVSIGINNISDEAKPLYKAQVLFQILKPVVSNLLLQHSRFDLSKVIISSSDPENEAREAFQLIEVELGFVYDMLYTKMTNVRFLLRVVLRLIGFLSTFSALVAFSVVTISSKHDHYYSRTDTVISYILLVGAIVLEIYSIMLLLFSDCTLLWISVQNVALAKRFYGPIWSCPLRSFFNNDKKRWSGLMAQHDLLAAVPEYVNRGDESHFKRLVDLLGNARVIQRWDKASVELKELIFNQLSQKRSRYGDRIRPDDVKQALEERGNGVLRRYNLSKYFDWSTVGLEFDHSVITWHIATSICYYQEKFHKNDRGGHRKWMLMSKSLSDYMMYLLVDSSNMLPKGIGEARYIETRSEIIRQSVAADFSLLRVNDLTPKTRWDGSCEYLHEIYGSYDWRQIKESVSGLPSGVKLASSLIALAKRDWSTEQKWKMISEVWVEMLTYAAGHCEWKEHAEALTRGGELLTHVYLLNAHLGLISMQRMEDYGTVTKPFPWGSL